MMRSVAAGAVMAFVLTGCLAPNEDAADGDCGARVNYYGAVYKPHNQLNQKAPAGRFLGTGDIIDCGSIEDADVIATVKVYAIKGVEVQLAVRSDDEDWGGVYVAEDRAQTSSWPEVLKAQSR